MFGIFATTFYPRGWGKLGPQLAISLIIGFNIHAFITPFPSVQATLIGVLYEGWHGYAAWAMSQVASQGGVQLSVEQVIQSNGGYQISDIFDRYGVEGDAAGFLYQATPQLG
jgi:hypothetical protein